jgi:tetratricopeptide (TPR) repeat protein
MQISQVNAQRLRLSWGIALLCLLAILSRAGDLILDARLNRVLLDVVNLRVNEDPQMVAQCSSLQASLADLALRERAGAYRGLLALEVCDDSAAQFLETWQPILANVSDDPVANFQLGYVHYEAGQWQQAIQHWRQAGASAHFIGVARRFMEQGQVCQGLQWAQVAEQVGPSNSLAQLYRDLAFSFIDESDWTNAVDACEAAVRLDPQSERAHYACGKAYRELGRLADAATSFKRSVELGGVGMWSHFHLGLTYYDLGEVDRAIQSLNAASAIEPGHEAPYRWLGYIYLQERQYEKALVNLHTSVSISPRQRYSWVYLLRAYEELGEVSKLRQTAVSMISVLPDSSTPYLYLANSLKDGDVCGDFVTLLESMNLSRTELGSLSDGASEKLRRELAICGLLQ